MEETRTAFEPLFHEITDGICISDLAEGVLYMNPAAERMLEVSFADARGRSLCELLCGHLATPGSAECMTHCALREQPRKTHGVTFRGRHGPKLSFEWKQDQLHRIEKWKDLRVRCLTTSLPLSDSWGPNKHLTILEDISAEMNLQRQKEDWQNMLVHDLRSPLSNIFAALRSWQDAATGGPASGSEKDKTLLDISVRSCRRMLELLNLYLDVAKLESGSMPVRSTTVAVKDVVRQGIQEQESLAKQRRISVSVEMPENLSAWADAELLLRVFLNLLNNALKFTPEGGRVTVAGEASPRGATSFSVQDTGPGIDPKDLPHLFDRFHQAKARQNGQVAGTGLGLAFCREALKAMEGVITVESTPGSGSRFVVRLPGAAPTAPAARHPRENEP